MGRFEVQGIVAIANGLPIVQMRQVEDNGEIYKFQVSPAEAREIAQNILEAATNAVYDAALIAWAKDKDPVQGEAMGVFMVDAIRTYRADKWGLPDQPEDWRTEET